jgi:hypothetical protein
VIALTPPDWAVAEKQWTPSMTSVNPPIHATENLEARGSNPQPPSEYPATMTMVNWPILISASQEHIGTSVTRKLDEQDIKLRSLGSYLMALYSVEAGPTGNLNRAISDDWMLRAISLGFLIVSEPIVHSKWMYAAKLAGHGNLHFAVYTCDAEEWRQILLRVLNRDTPLEVRFIANRIYEFLDQAGLRRMFDGHRKETFDDGTFILCKS